MHEIYQRGTCVVIQQIVIVDEAIFVYRNDRYYMHIILQHRFRLINSRWMVVGDEEVYRVRIGIGTMANA